MKRTPGPWSVKLVEVDGRPVSPEIVEDVIAADGTHVVCTGHDYDEGGYVSADDARLVARAPELLDALKTLADEFCHIESVDHDQEDWIRARAAIAAARNLIRDVEQ